MATEQTVDLIVRRLTDWGVRRIYGYAGDGNNPLLGALRRAGNSPEFVQAKHEEGAAFMATGEAKYTGGVGVLTVTQGPGAIHVLNGLYDAKLDSAAVVALVAQQHTSVLGSGYQQEVDLPTLFQDVSSFIELVSAPEQLPMVLDRAFRSALTSRQPAVLILPHDLQKQPAADLGQEHGEISTTPLWSRGTLLPSEDDLTAAVQLIESGERLAILAGQGAKHAQDELVLLAEHLGAGVATSLLGKPYLDESHPLAAGTMGHLGSTAAARVMQGCDTLLIVGCNSPWTEFYPPPGQARAVQVDIDPAVLANRYPVEVGLAGDAAVTLAALRERLLPRAQGSWREEVERHVRDRHEISRRRAQLPADPLNPELVVRSLARRIPADAQLAIDVGSCVYHYVRQMSLPTSVPAHLSSTLASMGCAVPYGIAAKESDPGRPVVAVAGDGAMLMLGNTELVTVAQRWRGWADPRFVLLVLHNLDLAEVTWEQRETESQPRFVPSQELPRFDFAGYAELIGLRGLRIARPEEIADVLDEAFASDRPVVVEALTDRDVPLLPPFPHGRKLAESMREGIAAEGDAGRHARELLDHYERIEAEYQ